MLPAFNEEAGMMSVVGETVDALDRLDVPFEIVVVDDASTDRTGAILDGLARSRSELRILHLPDNRGHGPALLAGLEQATGAWIGLLDGDGEVPVAELVALWDRRNDADLLLGQRANRSGGFSRRAVSAALRAVVRVTAHRAIADANVPCKLVRREWLDRALRVTPPDAFAPSVLLVVTVARGGGRIVEVPVTVADRPDRRSWLVPRRLAAGCARSLRDTIAVSRKL